VCKHQIVKHGIGIVYLFFISFKCVVVGDFNIDVSKDGSKANSLLEWADANFLAPYIPDTPTSLRSNRTVDYALSSGVDIKIQPYVGNTTSDRRPIFSIIPFSSKRIGFGKNTHWKVFSLSSEYTSSYWEKNWDYDNYTQFLFLLSCRCTTIFPITKYRPSIPGELHSLLSN